MTALLFAIDSDHSECVRQLLVAGASPDGPCWWAGECGRTPLVSAMLNDSVSSLRLLLQAGCQLDTPSRGDEMKPGQLLQPSQLIATGSCTDVVHRLILTAAAALGLHVMMATFTVAHYHII